MDYNALPNIYRVTGQRYRKGDHLFYGNAFGVPGLSHHGVFVGNGKVIHFYPPLTRPSSLGHDDGIQDKNSAVVQLIPVKRFEELAARRGSHVCVVDHEVRLGRAHTTRRCFDALGHTGYNAVRNNCEHFVNHCVLGERRSLQADALMSSLASQLTGGR